MLLEKFEKVEDIPAGFEHLYKADDDGFTLLPAADIKTQTDVDKIHLALQRERTDNRTNKQALQAFAGLDADDVRTQLDEIESLRASATPDASVEDQVTAALNSKTAPLQREIDKLSKELEMRDERINEYETTNRKSKINESVQAALNESKVRQDAMSELLSSASHLFDINDEGAVVTKDNVGVDVGLTPEQWIENKREHQPFYFPDSQSADIKGSANTASTITNPFAEKTYNLTQQTQLKRDNPTRYAALAKAAGVEV